MLSSSALSRTARPNNRNAAKLSARFPSTGRILSSLILILSASALIYIIWHNNKTTTTTTTTTTSHLRPIEAGHQQIRPVNEFASLMTAGSSGPIAVPGCIISGCSHQVCHSISSPSVVTTCDWQGKYRCYQASFAICGRKAGRPKQEEDECEWQMTPEMQECLRMADKEGSIM